MPLACGNCGEGCDGKGELAPFPLGSGAALGLRLAARIANPALVVAATEGPGSDGLLGSLGVMGLSSAAKRLALLASSVSRRKLKPELPCGIPAPGCGGRSSDLETAGLWPLELIPFSAMA